MQPNTSRPKPTRVVGVDYGVARLGVAVSDEQKIIATPIATVQAMGKSEKTAQKLLEEILKHKEAYGYEVEAIVIGLPLMMSGKMGMQADEVNHFVTILKSLTTIPILTWDERLTTVQAERSMREGSLSRKKRSKIVDKIAAVIILQNYLDHKSFMPNS